MDYGLLIFTREVWSEEIATCGDKTALTEKDLKQLDLMIAKVKEDQRSLYDSLQLSEEFIAETWERCF